MLQIAIWGIAIMLLVKGLDVLHQQSIAKAAGTPGSADLAVATAVIAVLGAVVLVWLAYEQGNASPLNPFESGASASRTETQEDILNNAEAVADDLEARLESLSDNTAGLR